MLSLLQIMLLPWLPKAYIYERVDKDQLVADIIV